MFTGIITDVATVTAIENMESGKRMTLACNFEMDAIPMGASIACDGACMTVIEKTANNFTVEISPESLERTTLGAWEIDTKVNLERPVGVGDEFGGHFVTGHVDVVGKVEAFENYGEFWALVISYPKPFGVYLAEKGSVAINGTSLTVNSVKRDALIFSVMVIPHTLDETNLGHLEKGSFINLEADLIARYLLAQKQEQEAA
ncbi:MAG: riboflavin synthase [Rickettsiales bacterium]|nr:riboflavin synthase [Rickettsiales bacterium]